MLNLQPLFKSDIDSKTLNLVPLVQITKGETLYVSTNSIEFDGNYYNPILLNIPSLKESVNFESRKYTISSVDLQLSNFPFEGDRLSDAEDLINAEVEIRWKSQSCEIWGDCLKVFIGKVRNVKTTSDNLVLTVEDMSQENLHRDLPASMTDDSNQYIEKYKNKPIPMVYGHVDFSPTIKEDNRVVMDYKPIKEIVNQLNSKFSQGQDNIFNSGLSLRVQDIYVDIPKDVEKIIENEDFSYDIERQWENIDNHIVIKDTKLTDNKAVQIRHFGVSGVPKLIQMPPNSPYEETDDDVFSSFGTTSSLIDNNLSTYILVEENNTFEDVESNNYDIDWNPLTNQYMYFYRIIVPTFDIKDLISSIDIKVALNNILLPEPVVDGLLFQNGIDVLPGSRLYYNNLNNYQGIDYSNLFIFDEADVGTEEGVDSLDTFNTQISFKDMTFQTSEGSLSFFKNNKLYEIVFFAYYPTYEYAQSHDYTSDLIGKFKDFDCTFLADIENDLTKDFYANVKGRYDQDRIYTDLSLIPQGRTNRTQETRIVNPMDTDTLISELVVKNPNTINVTTVELDTFNNITFPHPQSNIEGYLDGSTDALALSSTENSHPFVIKFRDIYCMWDDFISLYWAATGTFNDQRWGQYIIIGEHGEQGEEGKYWFNGQVPGGQSDPESHLFWWRYVEGSYYRFKLPNPDQRAFVSRNYWSGDPSFQGGTNNKLFFKEEFEIEGNPTGIISSFSCVTQYRSSNQNHYWIYDIPKVTATSFYNYDEEPEIEDNIIGCADLDADNYGYDAEGNQLTGDPQNWLNDQQVCVYNNSPTIGIRAWITNTSQTHYSFVSQEIDNARFFSTNGLEEFDLQEEAPNDDNNSTVIIIDFQGTYSAYGDDDNTSNEGESLVTFGNWDDNISFNVLQNGNMEFNNWTGVNGSVIMLTDSEDLDDNPRYGLLIKAGDLEGVTSYIRINVTVKDNPPSINQTMQYFMVGIQQYTLPILGCTDPNACNYNADATEDDNSCTYPQFGYDCDGNGTIPGCMDVDANNHNPNATYDDGSCTYDPIDSDGDGVPDDEEIPGCTDPTALNYNPLATDDNGSCIYSPPDVELGEDADVDFNEQDQYGNYLYADNDSLIKNPADIIHHILKEEIGIQSNVNFQDAKAARDYHKFRFFNDGIDTPVAGGWNFGFTVDKKINSKKLIEEIAKSTKLFPKFRNDGQFGFNYIKDLYSLAHIESEVGGNQDIKELIKNEDIINYKFSKTPLEQVYTRVKVLYKKDYADGDLKKDTDWLLVDDLFSGYTDSHRNYYGLEEESINENDSYSGGQELIFESEYIRDNDTAKALRHFLLGWYKEQHNIVELKLPLSYIGLEIGDTITFNEMVEGIKINGEDYSRNYVLNNKGTPIGSDPYPYYIQRNGQVIYPIWFITETRKNIDSIQIKAMQIHDWTASRPSIMGAEENRSSSLYFDINNIENSYYGGRGELSKNIGKLGKTVFNFISDTDNASWEFIGNDLDYTIVEQDENSISVVFNKATGNYPYNVNVSLMSGSQTLGKNIKLYRLGDINGDGSVSQRDINLLSKILLNPKNTKKDTMFLADINEDGVVDSSDLVHLQEKLDV